GRAIRSSHRRLRCRSRFGLRQHRESCKLLRREPRGNVVARTGHSSSKESGKMIVRVMPIDKSIRSSWRCDSCGQLVPDLQAGWVEWLAAEDTRGKPK